MCVCLHPSVGLLTATHISFYERALCQCGIRREKKRKKKNRGSGLKNCERKARLLVFFLSLFSSLMLDYTCRRKKKRRAQVKKKKRKRTKKKKKI